MLNVCMIHDTFPYHADIHTDIRMAHGYPIGILISGCLSGMYAHIDLELHPYAYRLGASCDSDIHFGLWRIYQVDLHESK